MEAACVKDGEFAAAFGVGQREFDGLIDAAGASRKGEFELFGAVGGEDEEDGGVFAQAIHFVEEFVEEAFFARAVHVATVAGDEINVFHDDDGGLKEASEGHVFAKDGELFGGDEEGGVFGKLAGEVMDGVGLSGAGRTVKEEAFFHAEFEAAEFGAVPDEFGDVAFEESDGLFGEDDFVAFDGAEAMDANGVGFAGMGVSAFQGENFAAVAAAFGNGFFETGHEFAGESEAGFAGWNGDFNDDAFGATEMSIGSKEDSEGHLIGVAEPESLFEAADGLSVAEIDFLVLKRADQDWMGSLGPEFSEGERVVAPLFVSADDFVRRTFADHSFERFLKIDTRGDGKGAAGGDDLGDVEAAKMFAEQSGCEGFCFGGSSGFLALLHGE